MKWKEKEKVCCLAALCDELMFTFGPGLRPYYSLFATVPSTLSLLHMMSAPNLDSDYFPARLNVTLNAGQYKILRKLGEGVSSSSWLVHNNEGG